MFTKTVAVDWTALDPLCQKAVPITGRFEGKGTLPEMYKNISGNFDGMGLSVGVLQWNYGIGSLQPLLQAFISRYGAVAMDAYFDKLEKVSPTATMKPATAVAKAISWQTTGNKLKPAWKAAWINFLGSQGFQDIQNEKINNVWQKTTALTQSWNLSSIRAHAFFFDILTQNGGMTTTRGAVTRAMIEQRLQDKNYISSIATNVINKTMNYLEANHKRLNNSWDYLGIQPLALPYVSERSQKKLNAIPGVRYVVDKLYLDCRKTDETVKQVLDILADSVAPQIKTFAADIDNEVNYKLWDTNIIQSDVEKSLLFGAAFERSQLSSPEWWLDVFNRKGTIAYGLGKVHTELYNLEPLYAPN